MEYRLCRIRQLPCFGIGENLNEEYTNSVHRSERRIRLDSAPGRSGETKEATSRSPSPRRSAGERPSANAFDRSHKMVHWRNHWRHRSFTGDSGDCRLEDRQRDWTGRRIAGSYFSLPDGGSHTSRVVTGILASGMRQLPGTTPCHQKYAITTHRPVDTDRSPNPLYMPACSITSPFRFHLPNNRSHQKVWPQHNIRGPSFYREADAGSFRRRSSCCSGTDGHIELAGRRRRDTHRVSHRRAACRHRRTADAPFDSHRTNCPGRRAATEDIHQGLQPVPQRRKQLLQPQQTELKIESPSFDLPQKRVAHSARIEFGLLPPDLNVNRPMSDIEGYSTEQTLRESFAPTMPFCEEFGQSAVISCQGGSSLKAAMHSHSSNPAELKLQASLTRKIKSA